jgi:hypothetical protein
MYETTRHTSAKLLPLHCPEKAVELPINLNPSTSYVRGTVLGQVTTAVNDVKTLTIPYTPTGGSLTMGVTSPITGQSFTFAVPYNSSSATAQTNIRAVIGANVTVSGGALPGTPLVFTFNGDFASIPVPSMTIVANALTGGTPSAPTIVDTTRGVTANTYDTYADAGSGGLDTARCILAYDCVTDSGGFITLGTVAAGAGERGYVTRDVPAYFVGIFLATDLTGLTAAAVADLGRLFNGTYATGVLSMS